MKRLLSVIWHEPLVQFLLIGVALFILFGVVSGRIEKKERILITASEVEELANQFSRIWLRPPTEAEMTGLVDGYVRDAVYHREALALGLDQNDPTIRSRMRQKLELILDGMNVPAAPSDQVLTVFMQEQADEFRVDPRVSFRQVYLNPDKRKDVEGDARTLLGRLVAADEPDELGDPTLLGYEFDRITQFELERQFGTPFAESVVALEPGVWSGPIYSGFGGHLVQVTELEPGRLPDLKEIRDVVEREWLAMRQSELRDAAYAKMLDRYEVVIEQTENPE